MITAPQIVLLMSFIVLTSCDKPRAVYHIPQGYIGAFRVYHNHPDGIAPEFGEDVVTYEIPADGVLYSSAKDYGLENTKSSKFYYVDSTGMKLREIEHQIIPMNLFLDTALVVYYFNHEVLNSWSGPTNVFVDFVLDTTSNLHKYPELHQRALYIDSVLRADIGHMR